MPRRRSHTQPKHQASSVSIQHDATGSLVDVMAMGNGKWTGTCNPPPPAVALQNVCPATPPPPTSFVGCVPAPKTFFASRVWRQNGNTRDCSGWRRHAAGAALCRDASRHMASPSTHLPPPFAVSTRSSTLQPRGRPRRRPGTFLHQPMQPWGGRRRRLLPRGSRVSAVDMDTGHAHRRVWTLDASRTGHEGPQQPSNSPHKYIAPQPTTTARPGAIKIRGSARESETQAKVAGCPPQPTTHAPTEPPRSSVVWCRGVPRRPVLVPLGGPHRRVGPGGRPFPELLTPLAHGDIGRRCSAALLMLRRGAWRHSTSSTLRANREAVQASTLC